MANKNIHWLVTANGLMYPIYSNPPAPAAARAPVPASCPPGHHVDILFCSKEKESVADKFPAFCEKCEDGLV
jgi:hypothetical protein